jgi:hypothetical protein
MKMGDSYDDPNHIGRARAKGAFSLVFAALLLGVAFAETISGRVVGAPDGDTLMVWDSSRRPVYQFVADGHGSSFWMFGNFLPFDPLHKTLYTLPTDVSC